MYLYSLPRMNRCMYYSTDQCIGECTQCYTYQHNQMHNLTYKSYYSLQYTQCRKQSHISSDMTRYMYYHNLYTPYCTPCIQYSNFLCNQRSMLLHSHPYMFQYIQNSMVHNSRCMPTSM